MNTTLKLDRLKLKIVLFWLICFSLFHFAFDQGVGTSLGFVAIFLGVVSWGIAEGRYGSVGPFAPPLAITTTPDDKEINAWITALRITLVMFVLWKCF